MPNVGSTAVSFWIISTILTGCILLVLSFVIAHIRSQPGKAVVIAAIVVPIGTFIACFIFYILAFYVEAWLTMPYIQQALDEQCGEGVVLADPDGYHPDDDYLAWSGETANCEYDYFGEVWECNCPPSE